MLNQIETNLKGTSHYTYNTHTLEVKAPITKYTFSFSILIIVLLFVTDVLLMTDAWMLDGRQDEHN